MLNVRFITLIARYTEKIPEVKTVHKGGLTLTLQKIYRLGEELVAVANSRDPFQIADEIGLQIQMVKDFTVLKGVYMILHEVPWAFINDNLDEQLKRIVCAHEIGHHLLHQDLVRQTMLQEFSLFDRKNRPEYEANVIAAEILLPDAEILDMIYNCRYDAFQIAQCTGSDVNLVALKCDILVEKVYDLHRIDHESGFLK